LHNAVIGGSVRRSVFGMIYIEDVIKHFQGEWERAEKDAEKLAVVDKLISDAQQYRVDLFMETVKEL